MTPAAVDSQYDLLVLISRSAHFVWMSRSAHVVWMTSCQLGSGSGSASNSRAPEPYTFLSLGWYQYLFAETHTSESATCQQRQLGSQGGNPSWSSTETRSRVVRTHHLSGGFSPVTRSEQERTYRSTDQHSRGELKQYREANVCVGTSG